MYTKLFWSPILWPTGALLIFNFTRGDSTKPELAPPLRLNASIDDAEIATDAIMAADHHSFVSPTTNSSGDVLRLGTLAGESTMEHRRRPRTDILGEIQLEQHERSKVADNVRYQSAVANSAQKNARRKQSLWLMRIKRFCNEVSIVGLRYAANPSASPFRRSIWVLLLVAGAAFTTFQIQNRIRYFLSRPVNVNLRIEHAEEIRFPTVTVCNENRVTYSAAASHGKSSPLEII